MKKLLVIMAVLCAGPALAGPFDGVFVSNPEGCAWLQKDGAAALFENDFLVMTRKDGIIANEYHCDFLAENATKDGAAIVITAFCEYPGEPFPDLISLREFGDDTITVTSLHDIANAAADGAGSMGGAQIYTRCSNLKELPVD